MGGDNFIEHAKVTIFRIEHGKSASDRDKFVMNMTRETEWKTIRGRVKMEMGVPEHEQLLLFRGNQIDQVFVHEQPLNTPDLEDIINECGEEGLNMMVIWVPFRWPAFCEKEALGEGISGMNGKKSTGASALHRAARTCELGVMVELLQHAKFSEADECDSYGQTALHTSVTCRNREAIEIVLTERPRDANGPKFSAVGVKDAEGKTALHYAAFWGDIQVCRQILESENFKVEDAKVVDQFGHTALSFAKECGNTECFEVIYEYIHGISWKIASAEAALANMSLAFLPPAAENAAPAEEMAEKEAPNAGSVWQRRSEACTNQELAAFFSGLQTGDRELLSTVIDVKDKEEDKEETVEEPPREEETPAPEASVVEGETQSPPSGPLTSAVANVYAEDRAVSAAHAKSRGMA